MTDSIDNCTEMQEEFSDECGGESLSLPGNAIDIETQLKSKWLIPLEWNQTIRSYLVKRSGNKCLRLNPESPMRLGPSIEFRNSLESKLRIKVRCDHGCCPERVFTARCVWTRGADAAASGLWAGWGSEDWVLRDRAGDDCGPLYARGPGERKLADY